MSPQGPHCRFQFAPVETASEDTEQEEKIGGERTANTSLCVRLVVLDEA